VIAILNFYSFGIRFAGSAFVGPAIRISDIFVVGLVVVGTLLYFKRKKTNSYFKLLLLLIGSFLLLEMVLPVVGLFVYSYGHIFNGPRIAFLYLPLLFVALLFTNKEILELNLLLETALKVTIGLNLFFGILQLLAVYDVVPPQLLLQYHLQHFAVDEHFRVFDGTRVSALTSNATELSTIGVIGLSHFLAKLFKKITYSDIAFFICSASIILLTASRVAIMLLPVIIIFSLILAPIMRERKKLLLSLFAYSFAGIFFILFLTDEFDRMFARILRLTEGIAYDYSLTIRSELWSNAIEQSAQFPFGTLSPPSLSLGIIDSGYLTYYLQGSWLFVFALVLFLGGALLFLLPVIIKRKGDFYNNIFLLNIIIYVLVSMVISNSMRSAGIIFYMLLGLINLLCVVKVKFRWV